MSNKLKGWIAPSVLSVVVIAAITYQLEGIRDRLNDAGLRDDGINDRLLAQSESVERRVSETNQRIDKLLDQQASVLTAMRAIEIQMATLKGRMDAAPAVYTRENEPYIGPVEPIEKLFEEQKKQQEKGSKEPAP